MRYGLIIILSRLFNDPHYQKIIIGEFDLFVKLIRDNSGLFIGGIMAIGCLVLYFEWGAYRARLKTKGNVEGSAQSVVKGREKLKSIHPESNIGRTARSVAEGWKALQKINPEMNPRDIAKTYVNQRYTITDEPYLAEKVLGGLPYNISPLGLSWLIFIAEHESLLKIGGITFGYRVDWIEIMKDEIKKCGLEPGSIHKYSFDKYPNSGLP